MFVVGLTGGIGTGKSTAAAMLAARGATIIDCDDLGRRVVEPGGKAHLAIVERFGPSVVGDNGAVDRPALAGIVFSDPAALEDLNAITHPAIDGEILDRLSEIGDAEIVILDMAVLAESKLGAGIYEYVVVVEADLDTRIARLVGRGLSEVDARNRIASQASDAQRRALADAIVSNHGDLADLQGEVDRLWALLREQVEARKKV